MTTGNLNLAVRRNRERFPADFMFQLNKEQSRSLILQIARSNTGSGGRRTLPYAFTEQGVAMLSSVLESKRPIQVNVAIMRAFVQLRQLASAHKDLADKIASIEKKYDAQFSVVFKAIRNLLEPPLPARRRIGFYADGK